jgi:hypothetical protein
LFLPFSISILTLFNIPPLVLIRTLKVPDLLLPSRQVIVPVSVHIRQLSGLVADVSKIAERFPVCGGVARSIAARGLVFAETRTCQSRKQKSRIVQVTRWSAYFAEGTCTALRRLSTPSCIRYMDKKERLGSDTE